MTGTGCNSAYLSAQPTRRIGTPYTKPSDVADAVPYDPMYDQNDEIVTNAPAPRKTFASEKPRISNGGSALSAFCSDGAHACMVALRRCGATAVVLRDGHVRDVPRNERSGEALLAMKADGIARECFMTMQKRRMVASTTTASAISQMSSTARYEGT